VTVVAIVNAGVNTMIPFIGSARPKVMVYEYVPGWSKRLGEMPVRLVLLEASAF